MTWNVNVDVRNLRSPSCAMNFLGQIMRCLARSSYESYLLFNELRGHTRPYKLPQASQDRSNPYYKTKIQDYNHGSFKAYNNALAAFNPPAQYPMANFGILSFWVPNRLPYEALSALSPNLCSYIYSKQYLLLFCFAILHP